MKKYNSPLEERQNLEANLDANFKAACFALGIGGGAIIQNAFEEYQNSNHFPLIGALGLAGAIGCSIVAYYYIYKANRIKRTYKGTLEDKIKKLSKDELSQLKQILSNKELLKFAIEIRDNGLEEMLLEREQIINNIDENTKLMLSIDDKIDEICSEKYK